MQLTASVRSNSTPDTMQVALRESGITYINDGLYDTKKVLEREGPFPKDRGLLESGGRVSSPSLHIPLKARE